MEKISYLGLPNCYRLANSSVELVVSTDIGPRVLRYGPVGGDNLMGEFTSASVETEYGVWRPFAGHRLWAAPEAIPFSYAPDNDSIGFRIEGNFAIRLMQSSDAARLEKEILVELDPASSRVRLLHRLTNRATETQEVSAWALTVFSGGTAHVPLAPYRSHDDALLPSQPMTLWPFTDLADPRIEFGGGWLRVNSDSNLEQPQKLGLANRRNFAAYHKAEHLFVKTFAFIEGAIYPDFGSNNEIYVAGDYMEIETLSPLVRLEPGSSLSHEEIWRYFPNVPDESVVEKLNAFSQFLS